MGPAIASLAWILSLAPLLLAALDAPGARSGELAAAAAASLGGLDRLPLALLPWAALAGLPGAPSGRGRRRRWPATLALSLPVLALAGRLDRAAGSPDGELLLTALGGLALAGLLAEASHRAASRSPIGGSGLPAARASGLPGLHGLAWIALVVAPPAVDLALRVLAVGPAASPAWTARWMGASPLGWLGQRAVEPGAGGWPLMPLAAALALLALAPLERRRPPGRGP